MTCVPAAGFEAITLPEGMMLLDAVLTVPIARPAPVIVVVRCRLRQPNHVGDRHPDRLAVQAAVAGEIDGLQRHQGRKVEGVVVERHRARQVAGGLRREAEAGVAARRPAPAKIAATQVEVRSVGSSRPGTKVSEPVSVGCRRFESKPIAGCPCSCCPRW